MECGMVRRAGACSTRRGSDVAMDKGWKTRRASSVRRHAERRASGERVSKDMLRVKKLAIDWWQYVDDDWGSGNSEKTIAFLERRVKELESQLVTQKKDVMVACSALSEAKHALTSAMHCLGVASENEDLGKYDECDATAFFSMATAVESANKILQSSSL
mmetsp:Transcript_12243/g.31134  ORF Transcript_12243/g.31134 Transcript_12243/m.31134 type:complete len:160 (-) Transcript_12243:142-621(-)